MTKIIPIQCPVETLYLRGVDDGCAGLDPLTHPLALLCGAPLSSMLTAAAQRAYANGYEIGALIRAKFKAS